jgi:hypothetical protein
MAQVIELLKEHPAIMEYLDELKEAFDMLRNRYREDFFGELRKQIQCGNTSTRVTLGEEVASGWYRHFELKPPTDDILKVDEQVPLNLTLCLGMGGPDEAYSLVIGVSNPTWDEIWQDRERFAVVVQRLKEAFAERYTEPRKDYWPLGEVVCEGCENDFMTPKFFAETPVDAASIAKRVAEVATIIFKYLSVLQGSWPGPAKISENLAPFR